MRAGRETTPVYEVITPTYSHYTLFPLLPPAPSPCPLPLPNLSPTAEADAILAKEQHLLALPGKTFSVDLLDEERKKSKAK